MTIDYPKIRIILNKYLVGEICLNIQPSAMVPESIEDLASTGFCSVGPRIIRETLFHSP
jgi:hypothetical protein